MTAITGFNLLLESLPQKDKAHLLAQGVVHELAFDAVLSEADSVCRHVYFPIEGFISLVARVKGYPPMETGLIGNEGMLGATLILGIKTSPLSGVVRGGGTALRITAPRFRRALRDHSSVRVMTNNYLYLLISELSQSIPCAHFHEVEPRLARWLLLVHDRAHADRFHLTHSFLASMLGVQRSAVTIAAGSFQKRHLIQYSRGEITVIDREGLEAASCACYRAGRTTALFD